MLERVFSFAFALWGSRACWQARREVGEGGAQLIGSGSWDSSNTVCSPNQGKHFSPPLPLPLFLCLSLSRARVRALSLSREPFTSSETESRKQRQVDRDMGFNDNEIAIKKAA